MRLTLSSRASSAAFLHPAPPSSPDNHDKRDDHDKRDNHDKRDDHHRSPLLTSLLLGRLACVLFQGGSGDHFHLVSMGIGKLK